MVYNFYDSLCTINLTFSESLSLSLTTRGNSVKLLQHFCYHDLRKHNFTRLTELYQSGIVYIIVLLLLIRLIHLRVELINSGNIKLCYIIIVLT